jgi:peptidoglycan/LPS O-acetylase OafA/YrhL
VPIAVFGPVGVLAAVPIAALSHRFVEQPFLKRRARPGGRQSSMVPSVAGQVA